MKAQSSSCSHDLQHCGVTSNKYCHCYLFAVNNAFLYDRNFRRLQFYASLVRLHRVVGGNILPGDHLG
jgi:hypothetical protein